MSEQNTTGERNPWKIGVLVGGAALALLVGGGLAAGTFPRPDGADGGADAGPAQPTARAVEDCNQYAASATRDNRRIVRDGLVGGAIGTGVGAAGGAIADGGEGAGKGAGIGALLGVTAGSLYGLNEENRKTEAARAAYRECMARRGYAD